MSAGGHAIFHAVFNDGPDVAARSNAYPSTNRSAHRSDPAYIRNEKVTNQVALTAPCPASKPFDLCRFALTTTAYSRKAAVIPFAVRGCDAWSPLRHAARYDDCNSRTALLSVQRFACTSKRMQTRR